MTSKPLRSVAADSNVLLSAAVGRAARIIFDKARELSVVTTEANLAEVGVYLPVMAKSYGLDLADVEEDLARLPIKIYTKSQYESHLAEAKRYLEKRDPDDVALAALALKLSIPIWSNDKDFRDVPVVLYPTAKLLKVLGL